MRISRKSARIALLILPLAATARSETGGEVDPQESSSRGTTYGFELDTRSQYLFRGLPFTEGPVSQIAGWVATRGFTFFAWGNFLLERELRQQGFSETNFGASYERQWKNLTLRPGFVTYFYHAPSHLEAEPTSEGSLTAMYTIGAVDVFTQQVVDVGSARGAYYGEAGVSLDRSLGGALAIAGTLSCDFASARYNQAVFGLEHRGFNQVGLEISVTWAPSERVYFRPHFELARTLDSDLRRRLGRSAVAAFGLAIAFERSGK
ncbi:MAG: hypothetical protein ACRD21_29260 [Vicinamibacteria bacterium]